MFSALQLQVLKPFTKWLEEQQNEMILKGLYMLNNCIGNYLLGRRKKDGSQYEPDTLSSYQRD